MNNEIGELRERIELTRKHVWECAPKDARGFQYLLKFELGEADTHVGVFHPDSGEDGDADSQFGALELPQYGSDGHVLCGMEQIAAAERLILDCVRDLERKDGRSWEDELEACFHRQRGDRLIWIRGFDGVRRQTWDCRPRLAGSAV